MDVPVLRDPLARGRKGGENLVSLDGLGLVSMRWQVQEAKQRFSEVVRAAEAGEPQVVTRHGEEIVVVVDIEEYRRLHGGPVSLMDYLGTGPCCDDDLEIERSRDLAREIDMAE
jgi:prevent-host-death family protein